MPVYEQALFASKSLAFRKMHCPVAEDVTSRILNLPIFPAMEDSMVTEVAESLLKEI